MKGQSLLFYILVILLNLFLFLPVIYYIPIAGLLHVIIFYLSFKHLLEYKKFQSNLSKIIFCLIPFLTQVFFVLCFFIIGEMATSNRSMIKILFDYDIPILIFISISWIEFIILYLMYSKSKNKRNRSV